VEGLESLLWSIRRALRIPLGADEHTVDAAERLTEERRVARAERDAHYALGWCAIVERDREREISAAYARDYSRLEDDAGDLYGARDWARLHGRERARRLIAALRAARATIAELEGRTAQKKAAEVARVTKWKAAKKSGAPIADRPIAPAYLAPVDYNASPLSGFALIEQARATARPAPPPPPSSIPGPPSSRPDVAPLPALVAARPVVDHLVPAFREPKAPRLKQLGASLLRRAEDKRETELLTKLDIAPAPVVAPAQRPIAPVLTEQERDRARNKRPVGARAQSISVDRLSLSERRAARAEYPEAAVRQLPMTRGECASIERPCPFVSCRHHLFADVDPATGSIKLNFPDREPDELHESCSLDVALGHGDPATGQGGGATLNEIANVLNVTRERVRQIEQSALKKLEGLRGRNLRDFAPVGPVVRGVVREDEDAEQASDDSEAAE
jgi:hypothetical protein